jgi:hypothetical protein
MADLQKIYSERFSMTGLDKRRRVWKILCRAFFDSYLSPELTVVDLACGYGEFMGIVNAGTITTTTFHFRTCR